MILNEFEIIFDSTDADQNERFEEALDTLQKNEETIRKQCKELDGDKNARSKSIRIQCEAIFNFFDFVLGEEIHKKIFKGKTSLKLCTDVLEEFIANVIAQDKEYERVMKQVSTKYSPDRIKR